MATKPADQRRTGATTRANKVYEDAMATARPDSHGRRAATYPEAAKAALAAYDQELDR